MVEGALLTVGRFGWCGEKWSVAKHIRANTAAHYRWAAKHFNATLKQHGIRGQGKRSFKNDNPRVSRPGGLFE
jgi:hypothetical protein